MVRETNTLRANIDTVSAMGRKTVVGRTRGDTVRLRLADGTWWIGVSETGTLPGRWTRVEMPHAGVTVVAQ
jgi:hypothetical protein